MVGIDKLVGRVTAMQLVGSRVTCNPAPTDTDQDVLVLLNDGQLDLIGDLFEWGFNIDGSRILDPADHLAEDGTFQSFSKDDLNIIVTQDIEFYEKFVAATHVAKRLNLLDKSDRIALFQAVLYANPNCFHLEATTPDWMVDQHSA